MLSHLQEKLAEAHGLAMAATAVTAKVESRTEDDDLRHVLYGLRKDAEETRARCLVVEHLHDDELQVELLAHANSTKEKAFDLTGAWFKAGVGPLAAWNFLAMAEAGEVAVWLPLRRLAAKDGGDDVVRLVEWALPVQERHLQIALEGTELLAGQLDPGDPRWG